MAFTFGLLRQPTDEVRLSRSGITCCHAEQSLYSFGEKVCQ